MVACAAADRIELSFTVTGKDEGGGAASAYRASARFAFLEASASSARWTRTVVE